MSVKLRLRRMGKKRQPIYKLVAADSRSPRDGRFIEALGQYVPQKGETLVDYKEERALYWLKNGAQPTDTVKNLLGREGTMLKLDLIKKNTPEEKIQEELQKFAVVIAEKNAKKSRAKKTKKQKAESSGAKK